MFSGVVGCGLGEEAIRYNVSRRLDVTLAVGDGSQGNSRRGNTSVQYLRERCVCTPPRLSPQGVRGGAKITDVEC